jgi:hypothetical protein
MPEIPREAQVLAQIVRWLKTVDGLWFMKTHGGTYGKAGVPDIIGCLNGRFFGIEVKRPGGKATELQGATMGKINTCNGTAGVAHSVAEAKMILGWIPREL